MEEKKKDDAENKTQRRAKLRKAGRYLLWGMAALVGISACILLYILLGAPDLDEVSAAPTGYRTTVLDEEGETILTLMGAEGNRVYAPMYEIPKHLQQAVVAIEDERFYQHHGIDVRGIARAVWRNLTAGRLSEGASTITQQLIKNNVFSEWTQEKSAWDKIKRKIQEQYLALQLERRESKDWILENYLNTINLGSGTWGVKTAALRYFGKEVSDLTLSECAVLAGITKSPAGYNPINHPEASRKRQLLVLDKMLERGMISRWEYDEARADDVYGRIAQDNVPVEGTEVNSYFEDAMIYQVVEDLEKKLPCTEEEAWQMLYRGGLTIHTTQDSHLQELCEKEVNRSEWYTSDAQASLVLMEPYSGQVKALVGGRGEKTASLTLNRATSSVRQPGSTIKVVGEYAAALDAGTVTLGTVYDDAPHQYSNGTSIKNANGKYGGRTTIRRGIEKSTNVVALKCFQEMGVDAVYAQLENFGLRHLDESDRVESLALGGTHGGVTNLEMTAAYSAIANNGVYLEPIYYTKITDRSGKVLLERVPEQHIAVQPSTAALLTSAMEGVLSGGGTGAKAAFPGMHLAGKSGTSSDLRDLWFVGYSPYYACGVWGGYDDFSEQSSSGYVKKIWKSVMQQAHEHLYDRAFSGTEGMRSCKICTKCGKLAIDGLCDNTVQGDMTQQELYVPGTEPTELCDCHVSVSICQVSGQLSGPYCRPDRVDTQAYLVEGTPGTADEEAMAPQGMEETCQVHQNFWDWMFPGQVPEETEPFLDEDEDEDDFYDWPKPQENRRPSLFGY